MPAVGHALDCNAVDFFHQVLDRALGLRASDIHLEPYEHRFRVRFRIDGQLHEIDFPHTPAPEQLVSRIKILSHLNIAEKRLPQDGRMQHQHGDKRYDIRVSSLPTLFGETVVLRILDSQQIALDLTALGFSATDAKTVRATLQKPHGMILCTGPTGSGKTATLYAFLKLLQENDRNICTVEDPVEIYFSGINQVHINEKAGLGFPEALRAFLRQDPDVIMLGEIRDSQTAEIAVKAAHTGHLLLSTLHTNDAPIALTRLRQMGVADYHIASSIRLVLAQRLLRSLCKHCKVPDTAGSLKNIFRAHEEGCTHCHRGYAGRIGVFQLLTSSDATQDLVLAGANSKALEKQAASEGMLSLRDAGIQHVQAGLTSLSEVYLHT